MTTSEKLSAILTHLPNGVTGFVVAVDVTPKRRRYSLGMGSYNPKDTSTWTVDRKKAFVFRLGTCFTDWNKATGETVEYEATPHEFARRHARVFHEEAKIIRRVRPSPSKGEASPTEPAHRSGEAQK